MSSYRILQPERKKIKIESLCHASRRRRQQQALRSAEDADNFADVIVANADETVAALRRSAEDSTETASSKGGGGDQWVRLRPDEIKSKNMIALANYTVTEHNREKKRESATDYDKCTTPIGSSDGVLGSYIAVVWVPNGKNLTTLVSLKKTKGVTCNLEYI
ncbi:DNA-directed RNA polymerase subunit alpha [Striga asiatica]|uniref:DNA-directed RNA polymerase subunit alpha n=1 Tax=Striga asiatica TaxID=4170 RepID=A0A5A7NXR7_STRAF|nr:DNA-directed RNA polymerase subunit alpha [Striga asiatica]